MRKSTFIALYFSWFLCCLGAIISLTFSNIFLIQPCNLCWLQRLCLFPCCWFLGFMAYDLNLASIKYFLWWIFFGFCTASYQFLSNFYDKIGCNAGCTANSSTKILFWIPLGSAINFLIIFLLLFTIKKWNSISNKDLNL